MSARAEPEASGPLLAVAGLSRGYGEALVVRDVSFRLDGAEILTLLGKNGMGKSTLLKTLMGFVPVAGGTVSLHGTGITGLAPHRIARMRVAYTPQEFTLFQDLTVRENLRLGVARDADLDERLDEVGVTFPIVVQRLKQRAGTLSGGEQKMLLLSRALVARPRIMLIDEISEGLQPTVLRRMAEVLTEIRKRLGVSILLIEQNLSFALSVADRYAVLNLGEIVESGEVGEPGLVDTLSEHLKV